MAGLRKILSIFKNIFWSKLPLSFSLGVLAYSAVSTANFESSIVFIIVAEVYLFFYSLRSLDRHFKKFDTYRPRTLNFAALSLVIYLLSRLIIRPDAWIGRFLELLKYPFFGSLISMPLIWLSRDWERLVTRLRKDHRLIVAKKILDVISSSKLFVILYLGFLWIYKKYLFDLVTVENVFVIAYVYYLMISSFIISIRRLRSISRFYSFPLSLVLITVAILVYFLVSPDFNPSISSRDYQYLFFYCLTAPIAVASISTLLLSIPAFIRLIRKKPQYFMFSFFLILSFVYILTVEFRQYEQLNGYYKFTCSYQQTKDRFAPKVVRIIGLNSEGSGFFIAENVVVTNRHVVEGEAHPKIVFQSGQFLTPTKVELSDIYDIAFLTVKEKLPGLVIDTEEEIRISFGEEVLSFGFALGSDIKGGPTILPLRYESERRITSEEGEFFQFTSPMVEGMSGGPSIDKCGNLVGINTITTTGTSLVLGKYTIDYARGSQYLSEPTKISLEPGVTPEDSVYAYYYLLKGRDTRGCYDLLSKSYKTKSTYDEWTSRFPNVINVHIFEVKEIKPNLVYVLFGMVEWIYGEQVRRLYEGTWETVKEDGVYLLSRSHILEQESIYDILGHDYFLNPKPNK